MKRLAYGGMAFVPMAVLTSKTKCQSMNDRLMFIRVILNNMSILWWLGAPLDTVSCFNLI